MLLLAFVKFLVMLNYLGTIVEFLVLLIGGGGTYLTQADPSMT
jgi:hypothetical protein